jgi:hypothetical protein
MELESCELPDLRPPGSPLVGSLISHRIAGDEGAAMFERLAESRESFFGVLLQWSGE